MTAVPQRLTAMAVALLAAAGLAACAKSTTAGSPSSASPGTSSAPAFGGTLKIAAASGPDHMDTVPAYFSADYILERAYARQLLSYPYSVTDKLGDAAWVKATTPVADIAAVVPSVSNGGISDGGRTVTFHLRPGVDWSTTPPRQVTAADFIREFKAFGNPVSPVGNPVDYGRSIVGMQKYLNREAAYFAVKSHQPTAAHIANYQNTHTISGISAPDSSTLRFKLIRPASDFLYMMAMPFASARPAEYDAYVPGSRQLDTHLLSDGPYMVTSYVAGKSIALARNPAWKQSTDPIRHQYVQDITVTDGASSAQTQLADEQAGVYDLVLDTPFEPTAIPQLVASHDPKYRTWPWSNTNPYAVFNLRSPNSGGAMGKLAVRQAVEYGLDKVAIQKIFGGPTVAQILSTAIPPGSAGFVNYNLYPDSNGTGNVTRCKSLLASAGYPHGITLNDLYISDSVNTQLFLAMQASLRNCGITLTGKSEPISSYFVDLGNSPASNKAGTWDIGQSGWNPDWFGNNGRTVIPPLFQSDCVINTNNYGCYRSPALDKLIAQAEAAPSEAAAGAIWHQADENVMRNAVLVPMLNQLAPYYSSARVENKGSSAIVFTPNLGGPDITNLWLAKS
jgi:peptide/nickel transport system substrate-binding protein